MADDEQNLDDSTTDDGADVQAAEFPDLAGGGAVDATILMCMKPTVVNSRLERIVGHASCQTRRLVDIGLLSSLAGK